MADEKIVVMEQSERELENYILRLDKHIEKFQGELKIGEEQKAVPEEHPPDLAMLGAGRTSKFLCYSTQRREDDASVWSCAWQE